MSSLLDISARHSSPASRLPSVILGRDFPPRDADEAEARATKTRVRSLGSVNDFNMLDIRLAVVSNKSSIWACTRMDTSWTSVFARLHSD